MKSPRRPHTFSQEQDELKALINTNTESSMLRAAAADRQYFSDPYAPMFVSQIQKKLPVINRGTFVRHEGLLAMMNRFLAIYPNEAIQFLSLGAGFDTKPFLMAGRTEQWLGNEISYFEVDVQSVVDQKMEIIKASPDILSVLENTGFRYACVCADLLDFGEAVNQIKKQGFDFSKPTCVLAECIFLYLEHSKVLSILTWIKENSFNLIMFDMVLRADRFSDVLFDNLVTMGIYLKKGFSSQVASFDCARNWVESVGFRAVSVFHMNSALLSLISSHELQRINRLEPLDEVEEWNILSDHYYFLSTFKASEGPK